jgi:hypothetical protein
MTRRPARPASSAPRDLRRGARTVPDWRRSDGGRAPRLGPREYIGTTTTRTGRFRRIDPLSTPQLWSGARWIGLVFWAGLTGEVARRAWKRHGGPLVRNDRADDAAG